MKEQEKFYCELYIKDTSVQFNISNKTGIQLSVTEKEMLDQEVTFEEIHVALHSLKKNKVPGCDGLSIDFIVFFWDVMKDSMWTMYQEVLQTKCLGLSAHKGLLTLIPKKGKDSRYIKNLRPLTLLNNDYKILAKVFATRLKKVLP